MMVLSSARENAAADPLSPPVFGPKLICFNYSTFSLLRGERITDVEEYPEAILVKIEGANGTFSIAESDIRKPPKHRGPPVLQRNGTSVYRFDRKDLRYGVYDGRGFSKDEDRFIIGLSGPAFDGTLRDAIIYGRFEVRETSSVKCQHSFIYSLSDFLPK